ncbi:MAG TPA: 16S rRNA (cytosine(1402)-N(4))-methyltransferase [Spirochaetaceae bacterium]|nr:16S rRNA (cytosine(1402)-N(4))-methyltransferase [Spirochaetaceae bacterium]
MDEQQPDIPHKRRPRYRGTHPRSFSEKYKEHDPLKYQSDVERVLSRGDTPAGMHRSICVTEILQILDPKPGDQVVDATLGYGGHARELLKRIIPGGRLVGLDADPVELPKTYRRLAAEGYGPDVLSVYNANFSALNSVLSEAGMHGAAIILADLGLSSMQIDNPERGFTFKRFGPLDMRMDPSKGRSAAELLRSISEQDLAELLATNADEPDAKAIAKVMTRRRGTLNNTEDLAGLIRELLGSMGRGKDERVKAIRRCFQALRIAVNQEFAALDSFLAALPSCLAPGGRVAILSFHSGEDTRVVRAFEEGKRDGLYRAIFDSDIRASPEERYANPRSKSARLRWAERA